MQIYNFKCLGKTKILPNFIAVGRGGGKRKSNSLFLETIKTLLMLYERKANRKKEEKNLLAKEIYLLLYQKKKDGKNPLRYVNDDGERERAIGGGRVKWHYR